MVDNQKISGVIFDWGGVFVDAETKEFFPGGKEILEYCKTKGYQLALAVIASRYEERKRQIENSGLKNFFDIVLIDPLEPEKIWDSSYTGKDHLYDKINERWRLPREEVLFVDDRTVRGIKYANQHGHPSIWIQGGKFAHQLPNEETGQPTYTIHELAELKGIL